MSSVAHTMVLPALLLLALFPDSPGAEKEVLGWNQTAGTNTAYLTDPYWYVLDEYSPHWFNVSCENDTLFDLVARPGHTLIGMMEFVDAAESQWPGKVVVPMVQLQGQSRIDSLLRREWRRVRIIDQIQAVVDTLHFDGINIDFEYPSAAMRDSFSAFMAELADSLGSERHVSCAVAAVRADPSIVGGFAYGVLSDGAHGDLVLEMVYDMYGPWSTQTGPTGPLWWWKENADTTVARYGTHRGRLGLAAATFGVDYHLTVTGNPSRRARAGTDGATRPYYEKLGAVIALSQATHDNNADNWPIQWSFGGVSNGVPSSYGRDSTLYIPYTEGGENRQLWWTGAEDWGRFMGKLDGVGIEHVGVWCAYTKSDSLIWEALARWKANEPVTVPLAIEGLWGENDSSSATNGGMDHPWTPEGDTLYLREHVLAPSETVEGARGSVVSDSQWDSMRFRYKVTRAGNVRLAVLRDAGGDRVLGGEDDTVCVFRSSLQDSAGVVSAFDEGRWGEPWAWVAENFGYTLKSGAAHGDTARVINEVVWDGEIDTLYVQRGPLAEEPWLGYPRRGTNCDSNYIADEGVYLVKLEVLNI